MLLISINDDRSKGLFPLPPVLLTITFHRTMTLHANVIYQPVSTALQLYHKNKISLLRRSWTLAPFAQWNVKLLQPGEECWPRILRFPSSGRIITLRTVVLVQIENYFLSLSIFEKHYNSLIYFKMIGIKTYRRLIDTLHYMFK